MNPFDLYTAQLDHLRQQIGRSCEMALTAIRQGQSTIRDTNPTAQNAAESGPDFIAPVTEAAGRLDEQAAHALAAHLGTDANKAKLPDVDLPEKPSGLELNDE
jgi:hypothetical protein